MLLYQLLVLLALLLIAGLVRRNHADYRRPPPQDWAQLPAPLVSILVPARNEAANIRSCLEGLLRQRYPQFEVVVLDDGSTDATAAIVERLAADERQLRLVRGTGLPPGWGGKSHACWQLAGHARGEWLLFVDADTRHQPQLLATALHSAIAAGADLLSTFPRQEIGSLGEALTVPFIYWVLFTLLPIGAVWESPQPQIVAGCGQLLLARRDAYFATGGHSATPWSLHDGLHLARLIKREGKRVVLADLSGQISCRMYRGWKECWQGFSRNAYQALGSVPALCAVTSLEAVLFLLPFGFTVFAAVSGWPAWSIPVLVQVAVLIAIQVSLQRRFRYSAATVLLHPLGVAALIAIQWRSWWSATAGRGGEWKGRTLVPTRNAAVTECRLQSMKTNGPPKPATGGGSNHPPANRKPLE